MLLYLSSNMRVDIAHAVSQIAWFGADPRKSHAKAVKQILWYLKGTADKGTIFKPGADFGLDLYVDADYCGLFKQEDDRDPMSAKSRTGYVIQLSGCPIIWKSTLQKPVSQSTLEAECVAPSDSLKVFLPIRCLLEEMIQETKCEALQGATIRATDGHNSDGR